MKKSTRWFSFLVTLLLLGPLLTEAQVRTRRLAAGSDLRAQGLLGNRQLVPTLSLPAVDAAPLLIEDARDDKAGRPMRFGLPRPVDVDILGTASKANLVGFRVYQYRIDAAGALSINLVFSRLQLKAGARMYLYNGDGSMLIGPITDAQNTGNREYWTDVLQGSNLTIEVQEPLVGEGASQVHLRSVVHGYKAVSKLFGQAGSCHPNMACYPDYQPQGDGVAMVLLSDGSRLCTGSMLNSMRQSFRSFFTSAFHCADLNDTGVLEDYELDDVQNWLVRFNYQSPTCSPSQEDLDVITLNGTTFRAGYPNSDVLLVELTQQIPAEVNTTYNGWNRDAATTSNNFGIHHPRGDVKKISFTNADTQVSGYGGFGGDTHVIAFWGGLGTTDPGSSGSPLFDGNRRIVGQLHGGPSFCGATGFSLRDYYGRFFTSWTGGGTPATRLSDWLDPDNTTNLTTDGVKPLVGGPAALSSVGTFALNTRNASVVSWSVTGAAGAVSPMSGAGNTANLTPLASASSLTLTFSVNDGQGYPIQFAKVFDTAVTPPPANTALTLLTPSYDCATGTIIFNTSGGDGSSITYSAVGVQRASATSSTGTVEAGLRADPKPLLITATQSGTTVSISFDFGQYCASPGSVTTTPPPSGSALTLLPPTYNCATGAITFNTSGGDGSAITYSAVGVQRASPTSSTGTVEAGLRADPKPLFITATQNGVTVSVSFDFGQYCASPGSVTTTPPPSGSALTLLPPTYNCGTGAITFNTSGGDGTPITYSAVGVQRASATSSTGTVEAGLRADPKPLVISATQSGVTTSITFNFGAFCGGSVRMASIEAANSLNVEVLGNPAPGEWVSLRVSGLRSSGLRVQTVDASGRTQADAQWTVDGLSATVGVKLGRAPGVYLLRVQSGTDAQTVRVVKSE
ncbi:hypothetical protein [Rudanella lutea]|uniref:hypothetical protein n=1 Tax=Rudanella lutea TaxID=451374 RepID=UPI000366CAD1|nr:hypothetical protein [Rudanella lutea]